SGEQGTAPLQSAPGVSRRGWPMGAPVLGEKSLNKASQRFLRSALLYLGQRCLGLWEPEGHLHCLVQIDSCGELGAGLLPLAGLGIQRAEAPVAVGLERTHAQILGQGEGLLVVRFGWLDLRGIAPRRNIAEQGEHKAPCGRTLRTSAPSSGTGS